MPRRNEKDVQGEIKDLQDYVTERKIEDGKHKVIRTICITATANFAIMCLTAGSFVYHHFKAVKAGILAFWTIDQGGGG
jgi:hypothetical protein